MNKRMVERSLARANEEFLGMMAAAYGYRLEVKHRNQKTCYHRPYCPPGVLTEPDRNRGEIVLGWKTVWWHVTKGFHEYRSIAHLARNDPGPKALWWLCVHEFAHAVQNQRNGRKAFSVHNQVFCKAYVEVQGRFPYAVYEEFLDAVALEGIREALISPEIVGAKPHDPGLEANLILAFADSQGSLADRLDRVRRDPEPGDRVTVKLKKYKVTGVVATVQTVRGVHYYRVNCGELGTLAANPDQIKHAR